MSKRAITVVLAILCIVGIAGSAAVYFGKDRKGPSIQVPAEQITYREGEDIEVLLEGVTAMDGRDKDVSDTLMVEKIIPFGDGATAQVVYAAMDRSNNVTKAYRTVRYSAQEAPEASGEKEEEQETAVEFTPESTAEPTPEATPIPTPETSAIPTQEPEAESVLDAAVGTELALLETCNVRQAPTTESEVIAKLGQGATVTKEGNSGEWVKVSAEGASGYIRSDLLTLARQ